METLQKVLSDIRELRHEELELVGGLGYTWVEYVVITQSSQHGRDVPDDGFSGQAPDWDA